MNSTLEKDAVKRDRSALEQALRDAGCDTIRGNTAKCPFHDDRSPSGSIFCTDGVWLFRCHSCKFAEDVIGITARHQQKTSGDVLKEMFPREPDQSDKQVFATLPDLLASVRNVEAHWVYCNPDTRKPEVVIIRRRVGSGKSILQARPCKGGYEFGAPPKPWPLFNRIRMRQVDSVLVVEGETCAECCQKHGVVATTSIGGAKNGKNADWSPLSGKRVILWPDNDAAGAEHMKNVAECLSRLPDPPKEILWVPIGDLELPAGGDVVDYLVPYQDGCDQVDRQRAIELVIGCAAEKTGADDAAAIIEETLSGRRVAIDWATWAVLSNATQALLPGTVTCICGDPGCGKSFFLLQAAFHWHANGHKVAIFELEEDRGFHLIRLLAQLAGNSDLTKAQWMHGNPDRTREAQKNFGPALRTFQPRIWDAPDSPPRLAELGEWVQERATEGCRIIMIDPITAASAEKDQWIADQQFVMCVKSIARRHQCSVIIATHPRMGKQGKVLDGLAGGAAYPRFSQTVIWINHFDKPKRMRLRRPQEQEFISEINRSIRLGKTRNGPGQGWEIGYDFSIHNLRFAEQGIVLGDVTE